MMESSPQFNLRWNNHSFNIIQVFTEQLSSESLVDVTLSCQGQFLKAHKMILSACSPYFQDLFSIHQVQHPVIILNGIKFHDLKMVVEFMYRGETRVLDTELNDILAVAEALQIKGLCSVRNKHDKGQVQRTPANESHLFEDVEEQLNRNSSPEVSEVDPLELNSTSESHKLPRKRKRPSEGKRAVCQNNSKVSRFGDPTTESSMPEASTLKAPAPKAKASKSDSTTDSRTLPKARSPRKPSSRASSPRASSPREKTLRVSPPRASSSIMSSPRASSPIASSPRALSPCQVSSRALSPIRSSPKASASDMSASKKSSNPPKSRPAKVYQPKFSSPKGNKPLTSTTSPPSEGEEENTEVLPFVQVAMNESPDDDIDLAQTIKVEPLFIRDIDDNDTSWDDPSRLVIDLPPEELEARKDESPSQESVLGKAMNPTTQANVVTTFVLKPKLKVRPASELVATSKSAQSTADGDSTNPVSTEMDEKVEALRCNERRKGNKIPRPPNAFMIFANEWRRKLALENPTDSNKQISVRLGAKWKNLSVENKAIYFTASRKADEEHKRKYPNYFYSPKEARLRKALRQKTQSGSPQKKTGNTSAANNDRDPLKLSTDYNAPTVYIAKITETDVSVKEELLDDESNPQNLEEEFLKMVEEGQVEAEIAEDEGETDTNSKVDYGKQAENH